MLRLKGFIPTVTPAPWQWRASNPQVLDTREVKYQCDCSKGRTKDMLLSLGRKELVKLRDEDPKCEVVCHFCHTKYEFDLNELLAETTPEEK